MKYPSILGLATMLMLPLSAPAQSGPSAAQVAGIDFSRSANFDFDAPQAGSYRLPVIKQAADGDVLDSSGDKRTLHDVMADRITVVSFIYNRCSDASGCPLAWSAMYDLSDASAIDPQLAKNVNLVTVSFDPEYDTPEVMAAVRGRIDEPEDRAPWTYLTTEGTAQLDPILRSYNQVVSRRPGKEGATTDLFVHQLRVYLIDRKKMVRNIYGLGFLDPRLLLTDIQTLLMEESQSSQRSHR
ncbi:SCO family protein [Magnetospira sp. QH-2]|uniref:SCO family protein n=1 Tax=Magnetospira sp. (strain QH-2) TaxID=1288970 RepID=UPI000AEF7714|nr:SCO family protein [Magnetospira sp. QH-2]